jgi:hypothetical protein
MKKLMKNYTDNNVYIYKFLCIKIQHQRYKETQGLVERTTIDLKGSGHYGLGLGSQC